MYREYRDNPISNRPCMKASQDRAYRRHLEALRRIKSTVNTSSPSVPKTIGRNMKRKEIEKQRNIDIAKSNHKLYTDLENIQRRDTKPKGSPQTHFTLRGSHQADQKERIDRENRKLVDALINQKPNINRYDLFIHNCDHVYQVNKMSVYKKSIPMSKIMRQRLPPMEDFSQPKSARPKPTSKINKEINEPPNTTRDNLFITSKGNADKLLQGYDGKIYKEEEEDIIDDIVDIDEYENEDMDEDKNKDIEDDANIEDIEDNGDDDNKEDSEDDDDNNEDIEEDDDNNKDIEEEEDNNEDEIENFDEDMIDDMEEDMNNSDGILDSITKNNAELLAQESENISDDEEYEEEEIKEAHIKRHGIVKKRIRIKKRIKVTRVIRVNKKPKNNEEEEQNDQNEQEEEEDQNEKTNDINRELEEITDENAKLLTQEKDSKEDEDNEQDNTNKNIQKQQNKKNEDQQNEKKENEEEDKKEANDDVREEQNNKNEVDNTNKLDEITNKNAELLTQEKESKGDLDAILGLNANLLTGNHKK